jgi:hypothetical protein
LVCQGLKPAWWLTLSFSKCLTSHIIVLEVLFKSPDLSPSAWLVSLSFSKSAFKSHYRSLSLLDKSTYRSRSAW